MSAPVIVFRGKPRRTTPAVSERTKTLDPVARGVLWLAEHRPGVYDFLARLVFDLIDDADRRLANKLKRQFDDQQQDDDREGA